MIYVLNGIERKPLKQHIDDRGIFSEIYREDWFDFLIAEKIKQFNLSSGYSKVVRAWHRHKLGQIDYFIVIKGALKIAAFDEESGELSVLVADSRNLEIVRIPGKYWHGNMVVSDEPALFVYGISNLYNHNNPDEERIPWNSIRVTPKSINGNSEDPRVNRPWDWYSNRNK